MPAHGPHQRRPYVVGDLTDCNWFTADYTTVTYHMDPGMFQTIPENRTTAENSCLNLVRNEWDLRSNYWEIGFKILLRWPVMGLVNDPQTFSPLLK